MNRQSNKITAIYTRVNAGGIDGPEIMKLQEDRLTLYAQAHNLGHIKIFSDYGYCGCTPDRPAFQELLAAVLKDQVAALVVFSLDRLCRDYMEWGYIVEVLLVRHKVALYSLRDQVLPGMTGMPFHYPLYKVGGGR